MALRESGRMKIMLTEDAKRIKKKKTKIDSSDEGDKIDAVIDLADLKFNELRKVAKKRGLWKKGMLKTDLVEILK